ncbi:sugar polymerase [Escherichia sp. E3659]|uniref:sugar polymerase n=1 Tax=Escherichia sp. E3659 TaxID=2044462 RepID=UPI001081047C|nr:sugar polymerase [Escherichia sp. E3659]TGB82541.1 sugar polymerase [Escherichia sp. E3659]TLJ02701.1 sugar polymerase [Escherichia sp. E3659]
MEYNKKLYIVACSYTLKPELIINKMYAYLPDYELAGVVISNNHVVDQVKINEFYIETGTNSLFEFSAYKEGIELLEDELSSQPGVPVLILNDTLFLKHNAKYILRKILSYYLTTERSELPVIVGRFDPYNNICYSNPWNAMHGYISSFCMLINQKAAKIIVSCYNELPNYFSSNDFDISQPKWGMQIEPRLREFIRSHLIDIHTDTVWYQAKLLHSDKERINIKAKCVFMEHFISGKIGESGIVISIFPTWKGKVLNFINEQLSKIKRMILTK